MEKHKVTSKWVGNMAFEGEVRGHKVMLDSTIEGGGENRGTSSKQLMLLALAGCTGTDILIILRKMRIQLEDLHITVEGVLTEEFPKYYHSMHIIYDFKGKELPADKLQNAIELSHEKYCGVMAVYKMAAVKITYEMRMPESNVNESNEI